MAGWPATVSVLHRREPGVFEARNLFPIGDITEDPATGVIVGFAANLWVALKHEITYRKPTFLDDEVIATVLLEKVQGARAFYETVIRRGEEVLAEVKSSWCCLDAQTLRPARLATNVIDRFFPKD